MIGGVSFIQFFVPVVQTVVLCADASKIPRLLRGRATYFGASRGRMPKIQRNEGLLRASVSTVVDGWRRVAIKIVSHSPICLPSTQVTSAICTSASAQWSNGSPSLLFKAYPLIV